MKHQNSKSKTIVSNSGTIKTKNTINHNNNTNLNNFNMGLLGYKETDYSHLTAKDYKQCICNCNESVRTLINKVHFNDEKPENKNIYISSMKDKYAYAFENQNWLLQYRRDLINDLFDKNEFELTAWYEENKHECSEIVNRRFKRYLENKGLNENLIDEQKDKIILDMYNKRKDVQKNYSALGADTEGDVIIENDSTNIIMNQIDDE